MNDMEYDDVIYLRNRYMRSINDTKYNEKSIKRLERQYKIDRDSFIIKQLVDLNNNTGLVKE